MKFGYKIEGTIMVTMVTTGIVVRFMMKFGVM
jgi:hypothetical protein